MAAAGADRQIGCGILAVLVLDPFLENCFDSSLGFAAAACSVGARRT
jgi:hypothetical protein